MIQSIGTYPTTIDEDPWADWLLEGRNAGDPEFEQRIQARVNQYIDHALRPLDLATGASVLDFGCGDGALGLRALQARDDLRVVFADTSEELLQRASGRAEAMGLDARCRFVWLADGSLEAIPAACVDAVCTRSALAYVPDKRHVLTQFHRVLRPGGVLSLAEPIFQDDALMCCAERAVLQGPQGAELPPLLRLLHDWRARQFPDTAEAVADCAYCNFSERDLFAWVVQAGFDRPHLELHIDSGPPLAPDWDSFARHTPHPFATSLRDMVDWDCAPNQGALLEQLLRGQWEQGAMVSVDRMAYLRARRPHHGTPPTPADAPG